VKLEYYLTFNKSFIWSCSF